MKYSEAISLSRLDNLKDVLECTVISSLGLSQIETYLKAYAALAQKRLVLNGSEFGDIFVSLSKYLDTRVANPSNVLLILDYEDLFPGTSYRSAVVPSYQNSTSVNLNRPNLLLNKIRELRESLGPGSRLVIVPPAMKKFPVSHHSPANFSFLKKFEFEFLAGLSQIDSNQNIRVSVLDLSDVLQSIPLNKWTDISMHYRAGWPYSTDTTNLISGEIIKVLLPSQGRKKILITDLDNTLWKGIVGEIGFDNVSWEQREESFKHLAYQKLLKRFSSEGILLAVASKNYLENAMPALERKDIAVGINNFSHIECGWIAKSEMIKGVLAKVNLLSESAVFVDDSIFEIHEVKSTIPDLTTIQFPKSNTEVTSFLENLASFFQAEFITEDDAKRIDSSRKNDIVREKLSKTESHGERNSYLSSLNMVATISKVEINKSDRAFQLLNKTNQFNLNGIREIASEWPNRFSAQSSVYQVGLDDELGSHGIIAILITKELQDELIIEQFVLSCRVFSRNLEWAILSWLLDLSRKKGLKAIRISFQETEKNSYVKTFLDDVMITIQGNSITSNDSYFLKNNVELPINFLGKILSEIGVNID